LDVCFQKLVLDLNRGEEEEAFDITKNSKKVIKRFRRGGSPADHRAEGGSDRHSSSSPVVCFCEVLRASVYILLFVWIILCVRAMLIPCSCVFMAARSGDFQNLMAAICSLLKSCVCSFLCYLVR